MNCTRLLLSNRRTQPLLPGPTTPTNAEAVLLGFLQEVRNSLMPNSAPGATFEQICNLSIPRQTPIATNLFGSVKKHLLLTRRQLIRRRNCDRLQKTPNKNSNILRFPCRCCHSHTTILASRT